MGLFTWLKNRIANRSIDELVNSGLKQYEIEYDPVIGARFYGTKSPELGFAIYKRFSEPSEFEMDQELADDICTFLKSFYCFFESTKNRINQDDFLKFTYMSYVAWQKIAKLKSESPEEDEEDLSDHYGEPQGRYLKINWRGEDTELVKQIKSRITPDMKLKAIDLDFSGIILVESELNKKGYATRIPAYTMDACNKRDVGYLIRKLYSCIDENT